MQDTKHILIDLQDYCNIGESHDQTETRQENHYCRSKWNQQKRIPGKSRETGIPGTKKKEEYETFQHWG